jgi:hypothetical protein
VQAFGIVVAVVSGAVIAALAFSRAAERTRIPAPAVFLLVAAVATDVIPLGALPEGGGRRARQRCTISLGAGKSADGSNEARPFRQVSSTGEVA